jgi:hypothetical protein
MPPPNNALQLTRQSSGRLSVFLCFRLYLRVCRSGVGGGQLSFGVRRRTFRKQSANKSNRGFWARAKLTRADFATPKALHTRGVGRLFNAFSVPDSVVTVTQGRPLARPTLGYGM